MADMCEEIGNRHNNVVLFSSAALMDASRVVWAMCAKRLEINISSVVLFSSGCMGNVCEEMGIK